MKLKQLTQFLMLAGVVSLAACSSPWKVVRKAPTNPFTKQERYVVTQTHTTNLQVGELAEAVYTSQLGDAEKQRWSGAKELFSKTFSESVKTNAGELQVVALGTVKPRDFQVYSNLYFVSPYAESKSTMVKLRVRLMQRNRSFDILLLQVEVPAGKGTIGNRLKYAAEELGKRVAKYLKERVR